MRFEPPKSNISQTVYSRPFTSNDGCVNCNCNESICFLIMVHRYLSFFMGVFVVCLLPYVPSDGGPGAAGLAQRLVFVNLLW